MYFALQRKEKKLRMEAKSCPNLRKAAKKAKRTSHILAINRILLPAAQQFTTLKEPQTSPLSHLMVLQSM